MPRTGRGGRSAEQALTDLSGAIEADLALIERQRVSLLEMQSAVLDLRLSAGPAHQLEGGEPIPSEQSSAQAAWLLAHSGGHVRSCYLTIDLGPFTEDAVIRELQGRIKAGFTQRTVYSASVYESPTGRRWMRSWAEAGEEQRISHDPPSEFSVFGSYAVMVAARWGDPASGYLLIRDPQLIATYTALFDATYQLGLAVPVPSGTAPGDDIRLLELLGVGLKDEAIARHLGLGLRTVRRRVGRLMDRHGVGTRYQLGAAAAAAGLIDPVYRPASAVGRGGR